MTENARGEQPSAREVIERWWRADFIAHARTDLPACLAALDAAEAERDEAIELLGHVLRQFNLAECACLPPCSIERARDFLASRLSQEGTRAS